MKTGIVGCGHIAWVGHLPWLWDNPRIDFVATCDVDPAQARSAADRWDAPRSYTDYVEMLDTESLDAVVIATPPPTHAPMAIAAAERGVHILMEKPMAPTIAECDRIIDVADANGIVLALGHQKRFNPGFEKVKEIIDDGMLGDVFHVALHWNTAVRLDPATLCPPEHREGYVWRWKDPNVGGGILQDHIPHYLHIWRWWTGSELVSISSELLNVRGDMIGDEELGGLYEDFGVVLMKFQSGCVGVFQTGTVGRGLSPIQQVGSGIGEWTEYGIVMGTRGHLVFDVLRTDSPELPRIMVFSLEKKSPDYRGWFQVEMPDPWRSPGGPHSPKSNSHYLFKRQMDHFADCVIDGVQPAVTGRDGRATIAAVEAVYQSHRSGQKVRVEAAR